MMLSGMVGSDFPEFARIEGGMWDAELAIRDDDRAKWLDAYQELLEICEIYELAASAATLTKMVRVLAETGTTYGSFFKLGGELDGRLKDELKARYCLLLTTKEAARFENPLSGWGTVIGKFSNLTEDISEANCCMALARYTAAVFHLMRIMEVGTQEFGTRIGVALAGQKVWQVILQEADKAIRGMDQRAEQTKRYAAISAHLYNVKLAWRNEVMHPKATYTGEEAEHLLSGVSRFMADLAQAV